ncbi:hypothetical protein DPQ25_13175 [Hydrogeniiclostridium mannosilyticum]|uniref:Uncharacterized protein n=1 Tax=Hydrogeniiclostridium mannosilyticum TaxID=2764322 RepID=A0A328U8J6_9FIRM|nr:hypothetical protein DPQ25_13175 [Hydrogeniiclostridium mannosilyticum]
MYSPIAFSFFTHSSQQAEARPPVCGQPAPPLKINSHAKDPRKAPPGALILRGTQSYCKPAWANPHGPAGSQRYAKAYA